jgi:predicted transcriptional regulator
MKTAKQELIELIEQLPDEASIDALLLELQFRAGVRRGLAEAERGEGMPHDEVKARIATWSQSSGRRKLSET